MSIERSKLASTIYGVSRNKGEGVGFLKDKPHKSMEVLEKPMKLSCSGCAKKGLYSHYMLEDAKARVLNQILQSLRF